MHNVLISYIFTIISVPFLAFGAYIELKYSRGLPMLLIGAGFVMLAIGFNL